MNDKEVAGFLTIDVLAAGGLINTTVSIGHKLPSDQTLRLRSYRVEMTSQANALSAGVLYVDLPFLSSTQIVDNLGGVCKIPIELDNAVLTLRDGLNKPIYISKEITETFLIRVLSGANLVLNPNLVRLTLQFETEKNALK